MRVAMLVLASLWGACGFHGDGASIDAFGPTDSEVDSGSGSGSGSGSDAGSDAPAMAGECNGKLWSADFSTDPTQQDLDHDGVMDWAIRDGSPFPVAQLVGGVWSAPAAGPALDTQPKQAFATRTIVHARMRGTTVGASSQHGAVFWINVGYAPDHTFAPLFLDAKLTDDSPQAESFAAFTKTAAGQEQSGGVADETAGDAFHEFTLDIDPGQLRARITYDGGSASTITLVRQDASPSLPNPGDQWATVTPFSTGADFDYITVEACP